MVARQLKIVSQSDAFTISARGNIEYVFKKLACLIVFVKDIFDIIYYITICRQTGSSQKVKLLTTIYVIYKLISQYNFKYIFVKVEMNKLHELS